MGRILILPRARATRLLGRQASWKCRDSFFNAGVTATPKHCILTASILPEGVMPSVTMSLMPTKHRIEFREVASPITDTVTKFGGQPNWVTEPQWPLSRSSGNAMRFICQIELTKDLFPNTTARMAYLFMTDEEGGQFVDGTYDPNRGENAVILQPGRAVVPTRRLSQGPTLYRLIEKSWRRRTRREPCEFAVQLIREDDVAFLPEEERWKLPDDEAEAAAARWEESKIGGTPVFMQGDEFPFTGPCRLLLQLDSCSVPFSINFGDAGVGYAFLNEAGDEAKFLFQCG